MDRRVVLVWIAFSTALNAQEPFSGPVPLNDGTFAIIRCDERAGSTVRLSLITVPDRRTADEVFGKLRKGETFSSLAMLYSTNPSRTAGGALLPVEVSHLRSELQAALKKLPTCPTAAAPAPEDPRKKAIGDLHSAAAKGDIGALEAVTAQGIPIDERDTSGLTPLHIAVNNGHADVVESLVKKGANIDSTTMDGSTALILAITGRKIELARILLTSGANVNLATADGRTALFVAAEQGRDELVNGLLEKGALPDGAPGGALTPLHIASQRGFDRIVRSLLRAGANPNRKNSDGITPLFAALSGRHMLVARLLVERGADINIRANDGTTPLTLAKFETTREMLIDWANLAPRDLLRAAEMGELASVRSLVERGVDVDVKDSNGQTSLIRSAYKGHVEVVSYLLDRGAAVDHHELVHGKTALIAAAEAGHEVVVKYLLQRGASTEAASAFGTTALTSAAQSGHLAVVRLLVENGAVLDARGNEGQTPLMLAAVKGYVPVVWHLRSRGANVNATDNSGRTALDYAKRGRRFDVANALVAPLTKPLPTVLLPELAAKLGTAVAVTEANEVGKVVRRYSVTVDRMGVRSGGLLPDDTQQYSFKIRIANLLDSTSNLGLGPLEIVDEAGTAYAGFFHTGPVFGVSGLPSTVIMGEASGEPFGSFSIAAKSVFERDHLIVNAPASAQLSQLTLVVGDLQPKKLRVMLK